MVLFITRTWHGIGGLQRLSRDLWREMEKKYGSQAAVIHPSKPGFLALIAFACRSIFRGLRAGQSVHIHLGDASLCPLGVIISAITGARISVTVAGLDVIYARWWYQWLLRRSLPTMHCVCCISEATAIEVRKRGVRDDRIVVIPCGINTSNLPVRSSNSNLNPTLLMIGRLIPRKGAVWFVDQVLPPLLKRMPHLQLRIIGDGPDRPFLERLIRCNCLGDHLVLLGAVDDDRRNKEILAADLFLMPNIPVRGDSEGFGIVCIEASARGLPVVASRLEGITEAVIEGETGQFFKAGDVDDCIRVITDALTYPLDPVQVAAATKAHYDWSHLIERYATDVFR